MHFVYANKFWAWSFLLRRRDRRNIDDVAGGLCLQKDLACASENDQSGRDISTYEIVRTYITRFCIGHAVAGRQAGSAASSAPLPVHVPVHVV